MIMKRNTILCILSLCAMVGCTPSFPKEDWEEVRQGMQNYIHECATIRNSKNELKEISQGFDDFQEDYINVVNVALDCLQSIKEDDAWDTGIYESLSSYMEETIESGKIEELIDFRTQFRLEFAIAIALDSITIKDIIRHIYQTIENNYNSLGPVLTFPQFVEKETDFSHFTTRELSWGHTYDIYLVKDGNYLKYDFRGYFTSDDTSWN